MANETLINQTATTEISSGDLLYVVRDPAGTPVDRKMAFSDLSDAVMAAAMKLPSQRVGRRVFNSRMANTIDNSTSKTFQVTVAAPAAWDAVRPIFANSNTNYSTYCLSCKLSVISSTADLNNSAGTWTQATKNGLNNIPIPLARSTDSVAYETTDWIPVPSVARSDGGAFPLVVIRGVFDAISTLTGYGNGGTDDLTNWATAPDGMIWCARQQDGDFVTSPAGFNSTANTSTSPIVGVEFLLESQVVAVSAIGDSEIEGRANYIGASFAYNAATSLNGVNGKTVSYANYGWSAQTTSVYTARALELLDSPQRPDVLVFLAGSPNDISTTISASDINLMASNTGRIIAKCKQVGTVPVVGTWLPTNTAVKDYGPTDALRVAYNAMIMSMSGVITFDAAAPVNGLVVNGQVQMKVGSTNDGIHPNTQGNLDISNQTLLDGTMAESLEFGNWGFSPYLTRKDMPFQYFNGSTSRVLSPFSITTVTGSGASPVYTLPNPAKGVLADSRPQVFFGKNKGTGNISFTAENGGTFSVNNVAIAPGSYLIPPGKTFMVYWDGAHYNDLLNVPAIGTSRVIPLTGATVTVTNTLLDRQMVVIAPAGTIAALTIAMPTATPQDGQIITLKFKQIVTAITMSGPTIDTPLTTATAGQAVSWQYCATTTTWERMVG